MGYIIRDNHINNPDPFLLTDSKVMKGQGRAIVLAVGSGTVLAKSRKPGDLTIEEQETDLEKKLQKASEQIGKFAWMFLFILVVTSAIFLVIYSLTQG